MTPSNTRITIAAREDWLAERRKGVGASEAAAVLGVCPFRTPIDVWQQKTGRARQQDENEAMLWGNLLEPVICDEYQRRTGRAVTDRQLFLKHPLIPHMLATLDGIAGDRLLEIKTASAWAKEWGDEDTDAVPEPYLIQVQHQMAVAGYDRADVAVLIGGQRLRVYTVERHEELIAHIVEQEARFWECVQTSTPPDWGRMDARTLAVLNPHCEGSVDLDDDARQWVEDYDRIGDEIRRMEGVRELHRDRVLAVLGNSEFGVLPDGSRVKRFRQEVAESARVVKSHVRHYFKRIKGAES